jgi:hypothetical protein
VFWGSYRMKKPSAEEVAETPRVHYARLLHPMRWVRWRLEVHRQGPYAPDFGKQSQPEAPGDYSDGTAIESK